MIPIDGFTFDNMEVSSEIRVLLDVFDYSRIFYIVYYLLCSEESVHLGPSWVSCMFAGKAQFVLCLPNDSMPAVLEYVLLEIINVF